MFVQQQSLLFGAIVSFCVNGPKKSETSKIDRKINNLALKWFHQVPKVKKPYLESQHRIGSVPGMAQKHR
jgi:hypothetical protein